MADVEAIGAVWESLRAAIRDSGLTPYEISKRAGCVPQQIYRFLSEERGLTLETAGRVAAAVGRELVVELR